MQTSLNTMNSPNEQTCVSQRCLFNMSVETMAAFHGLTNEKMRNYLYEIARKKRNNGENYEKIKSELKFTDEELQEALTDKNININNDLSYAVRKINNLEYKIIELERVMNNMREDLNYYKAHFDSYNERDRDRYYDDRRRRTYSNGSYETAEHQIPYSHRSRSGSNDFDYTINQHYNGGRRRDEYWYSSPQNR